MLARSFKRNSLRLVDPLEFMRQKAAEGIHMFGSLDPHLNAEGHRIVSEYVAPFVEEYLSTIQQKDTYELDDPAAPGLSGSRPGGDDGRGSSSPK